MIRWIAFDVETAEAVVSRFKRGGAEIQQGSPLTSALQDGRSSLLLLPSPVPGRMLLARFEPSATAHIPAARPITWAASGFLGLSDEPVFDEPAEIAPPRKKWWRRSA